MEPIEISILAQQPVPIRLTQQDGSTVEYHLPLLGVRGLLPWLAELTDQYQKTDSQILSSAKYLAGRDRFDAERMIARNEAVIDDLPPHVMRPAGIERVLRLSIDKSDVPPDQREAVLDAILNMGYIAQNLAVKLSTLFKTAEPAPATNPPPSNNKQDTSSPLSQSAPAASGGDGGASIGSPAQ